MAYARRAPPQRTPPPELDGDLTASDLAYELCQLDFDRKHFNAIRIDADVRDFLVGALARHVMRRD